MKTTVVTEHTGLGQIRQTRKMQFKNKRKGGKKLQEENSKENSISKY